MKTHILFLSVVISLCTVHISSMETYWPMNDYEADVREFTRIAREQEIQRRFEQEQRKIAEEQKLKRSQERLQAKMHALIAHVKYIFEAQIIPQYQEHLRKHDHNVYVVWDIDDTLLDSTNIKKRSLTKETYHDMFAIPAMRELFHWIAQKGFKSVFTTGRFDTLLGDRAAFIGTLENLKAEISHVDPDVLHCLPKDKYGHIDLATLHHHVIYWKEEIRTTLVKQGYTIAATFDDCLDILFDRVTREPRAHVGQPFHVPSQRNILEGVE